MLVLYCLSLSFNSSSNSEWVSEANKDDDDDEMNMMWLNTMPTFSDWLDRDCYHIWQPQLQRILPSWFWTYWEYDLDDDNDDQTKITSTIIIIISAITPLPLNLEVCGNTCICITSIWQSWAMNIPYGEKLIVQHSPTTYDADGPTWKQGNSTRRMKGWRLSLGWRGGRGERW